MRLAFAFRAIQFTIVGASLASLTGCLSLAYTGAATDAEDRLSALESRVSHLEQTLQTGPSSTVHIESAPALDP
jgi:hypothetical protein